MLESRKYLNNSRIPLALAVFLASDPYDHESGTVSATSLIKPIRPLILSERVGRDDTLIDVADVVQSRVGHAIHDGIERAWIENHEGAMASLGIPKAMIERVRLNPTPEDLQADPAIVPVYTEQRHYKNVTVGNFTFRVSGRMDFIAEGVLQDFKSTTCFHYQNQTKREANRLQGSLYRWLAPELITMDFMQIHYVFLDWAAYRLRTERNYPASRVLTVKEPLMTLPETEAWVGAKLALYARLREAPESEIPLCTPEELWATSPVWKYYANPEKRTRSTKNFDNPREAYARLMKDGNTGVIVEVPSEVRACRYCPAFNACSQKDALIREGVLKI